MNGFVPAIVAVMLAELGPRALLYADARRQEIVLWFIAAVVFIAGAAGVFAWGYKNLRSGFGGRFAPTG